MPAIPTINSTAAHDEPHALPGHAQSKIPAPTTSALPNGRESMSLAIVGGGIAGLVTALAILNHSGPGITITIYESAQAFTETGAGVNIGPNASRALRLISPELARRFAKGRTGNDPKNGKLWLECRAMEDHTYDHNENGAGKTGAVIVAAEENFMTINNTSRWSEEPIGGLKRSVLLEFCSDLLPDNVAVFGKRLVDVEHKGNCGGRVFLHFEDGTTGDCDAVLGCDGIKSCTRRLVLGDDDPAAHPVFSGQCCYRGLVPIEPAIELIGEKRVKNGQLYHGHGRYIITYPIAGGAILNLGAYSTTNEPWTADEWVVPASKESMLEKFEGIGSSLRQVLQLVEQTDAWALFDHEPAKTFYRGRMCLMGDAAHASLPHQGAGAGFAVEDAYILAMLLREIECKNDLRKVFRAYDAVRRPRGLQLVETSRQSGKMICFELDDFGHDLERIGQNWQSRMKWIWDYDIEEESTRAKRIFEGSEQG